MLFQIAIMALIGTVIGWFTNYLAIKLIFRPLTPWRIPGLNIEIQGLIPKRRREIAKSIGQAVEEQLLSIEELVDRLVDEENKKKIISEIKFSVVRIVKKRIPSFVPGGLKDVIVKYISNIVDNEIEDSMNQIVRSVISEVTSEVSIKDMVEDKINSFDLATLESMVVSIARKELRHIEVLGGILGFLIGLFQGVFIHIFL